jgi:hypothetical protein
LNPPTIRDAVRAATPAQRRSAVGGHGRRRAAVTCPPPAGRRLSASTQRLPATKPSFSALQVCLGVWFSPNQPAPCLVPVLSRRRGGPAHYAWPRPPGRFRGPAQIGWARRAQEGLVWSGARRAPRVWTETAGALDGRAGSIGTPSRGRKGVASPPWVESDLKGSE